MLTSSLERMIQPIGPMNVDLTHIRMLYEIIMIGKFEYTLEIGSYDGASAIAFVAALNDFRLSQAHFCDTKFQPRFHDVINECLYPGGVRIHECHSYTVLGPEYDFVFVDGDHSLQNVRGEVDLLLKHRIRSVAAHDTNSTKIGIQNCEGAAYLRDQLKAHKYHILEDCAIRPGERTERGFMFATTDGELAKLIQQTVFKLA